MADTFVKFLSHLYTVGGIVIKDISSALNPTSGEMFLYAQSGYKTPFVKRGSSPLPLSAYRIAIFSHQAASGTDGGGPSAANTWTTRPITTEDYDPFGIVSISSNQFSITTDGDYLVLAVATFHNVDRYNFRLYNVTDSTVALNGTSGRAAVVTATGANPDNCLSAIVGVLDFPSDVVTTKTFRFEASVQTANATHGWGRSGARTGGVEVYLLCLLIALGNY
ncbi:MAG: hypothetical protein QXS68_03080 [Candidatus Methanomethylicaceae archaeon]